MVLMIPLPIDLSHTYIRVEQIGVSDAIGPASYALKYENSKLEHEVVKLHLHGFSNYSEIVNDLKSKIR